jgi:hypothetical protein
VNHDIGEVKATRFHSAPKMVKSKRHIRDRARAKQGRIQNELCVLKRDVHPSDCRTVDYILEIVEVKWRIESRLIRPETQHQDYRKDRAYSYATFPTRSLLDHY